jgi:hypothetical protein
MAEAGADSPAAAEEAVAVDLEDSAEAASAEVVQAVAGSEHYFFYAYKVTQRYTEETQSYTEKSSVDLCDASVK